MSDFVLEVKNLTKKFGKSPNEFIAVNNISFSMEKGKVLGFLGPNGAGKTTTIHMLLGITSLTAGEIKYFGKDFLKNKEYCLQRINFASAFNTLQGHISVWENLLVFSYLYSIKNPKKKIMELVEYFEIGDLLKKRFYDISSGQKTRVNIIKSLINDPELILMDEPTASLDPDIADKTLTLIETLKKDSNLSILYTSHNMDEVTRLCDEVIFLNQGKIVMQDTPLNLTKKVSLAELILTFDAPKKDVQEFLKLNELKFSFEKNNIVNINIDEKNIPKIIFKMSKAGIWITDIQVKKPTLEDVFLQIARGENF
ncbi:MAG: ABC transporter ATP-binding protein [Candidatus Levybacteria bacterium]|nr:ABC transporter ATP-binding protein [Candidatus Levybacteria bacterium]